MEERKTASGKTSLLDRFFGGDRILWTIIVILSIVSLLVIYSSTASMAYRKAGGDEIAVNRFCRGPNVYADDLFRRSEF